MKNILLLLFVASVLFTTACGNDDDDVTTPAGCVPATFSDRNLVALNLYTEAAINFSNDPSTANCEAFRSAGQDYLDFLREFEDCTLINSDEDYQQSVREAQMELDDLTC